MFFIRIESKSIRKRFYFFLIIFLVIIATVISTTSKLRLKYIGVYGATGASNMRTVILDAGHGGEDSGAIGVNGVYEKDLNFVIANTLGEYLESNGFKVIYTRTDDKLLYTKEQDIKGIRKISDLKNRCKIANNNPDALFISIHMNSYSESRYKGLQVYYTVANEESMRLAGCIQSSVKETLQPDNNRRIKEGKGLYLLENIESVGVLIECGFLTNREECEKLSEKEYQKQLSFSIICGIIEYVK